MVHELTREQARRVAVRAQLLSGPRASIGSTIACEPDVNAGDGGGSGDFRGDAEAEGLTWPEPVAAPRRTLAPASAWSPRAVAGVDLVGSPDTAPIGAGASAVATEALRAQMWRVYAVLTQRDPAAAADLVEGVERAEAAYRRSLAT